MENTSLNIATELENRGYKKLEMGGEVKSNISGKVIYILDPTLQQITQKSLSEGSPIPEIALIEGAIEAKKLPITKKIIVSSEKQHPLKYSLFYRDTDGKWKVLRKKTNDGNQFFRSVSGRSTLQLWVGDNIFIESNPKQ